MNASTNNSEYLDNLKENLPEVDVEVIEGPKLGKPNIWAMRRKCNLDIILKKSKFFSQFIVSHLITEARLLGHQGSSVLHPTKNLEKKQEIELLSCDLNMFW